jgi:hypothetical protein
LLNLIFPESSRISATRHRREACAEQGHHGPVSERQQSPEGEEGEGGEEHALLRHARARPSTPIQRTADALLHSRTRSQVVMEENVGFKDTRTLFFLSSDVRDDSV